MPSSLYTLPIIEQLSSAISLRQLDELTLVVVDHANCRAAVTLQGGQLIAWQPTGEQPIIWLSSEARFKKATAIRGGVPISWPWFANAGTPAHGFARTADWQLISHQQTPDGVELQLRLTDTADSLVLWPHRFALHLTISLGQQCQIKLEIVGDFHSTAALHSYFQVADIHQVHVAGLGTEYFDKVQGQAAVQQTTQVYQQEVDRIFTAAAPCSVINDPVAKRLIQIEHHNNSDVVTWNPWATHSVAMGDMHDDGYKTLVCVETARINRPLISRPGKPAELSVVFRVENLLI